jgi:hypothetical protein
LHPISLEEEISVDVEITRVIAADFRAKLFLNVCSVQEFANPPKSRVAKVIGILAFATDIINVLVILAVFHQTPGCTYLTSPLVWTN